MGKTGIRGGHQCACAQAQACRDRKKNPAERSRATKGETTANIGYTSKRKRKGPMQFKAQKEGVQVNEGQKHYRSKTEGRRKRRGHRKERLGGGQRKKVVGDCMGD